MAYIHTLVCQLHVDSGPIYYLFDIATMISLPTENINFRLSDTNKDRGGFPKHINVLAWDNLSIEEKKTDMSFNVDRNASYCPIYL